MSLFKKIGRVVKKGLKIAAPFAGMIPGLGPVASGVLGKIGGGISAGGMTRAALAMPMLPPLIAGGGAVVRTLPGIGRAAGRVLRSPTGRGVAGGAAGAAIFDAAGNYLGQKARRRKINPLNHKALNRALQRVERAKKTCARVNRITIRKEKC